MISYGEVIERERQKLNKNSRNALVEIRFDGFLMYKNTIQTSDYELI